MAEPKRVFSNTVEKISDIFRVRSAKCQVDESIHAGNPVLKEHEHAHMFKTVMRKDAKNDRTTSKLGHFHNVKIIYSEGKAPKAVCGPPLKYVYDSYTGGKKIKEMAYDDHTHDIAYMRSEKVKVPADDH